jgi:hypothetical protein
MNDELDIIRTELDKFASKRGPAVLVQAQVTEVNETDATIAVELEEGGTIDDVQLRSVVDAGKKIVSYPKTGSYVLIASILSSEEYYVVAVAEVSKVLIEIGSLKLEITDKVKITSGANSLKDALIKMIDATSQIVVLEGNNPNYVKLAEAKVTVNAIMD